MTEPRAPQSTIDPVLLDFLEEARLVRDGDYLAAPLTGGVSSDIWRIDTPSRAFVVKRALSRLRVAQDWTAPVSRNASEVEWLLEAGRVVPQAVPTILAHDGDRGMFAMAYLDPAEHPVWKSELLQGRADPAFAAETGRVLAAIHAATAGSLDAARRFANDDMFHQLRLEPYLEATARVHEDLASPLMALSRATLATKKALVHGDVSPKNILQGPRGPVILDAECAWYGDPAFDLAFCLNHLLLKALWSSSHRNSYLASFDAMAAAYLDGAAWEERAALEARVAALLPALALARVDGKSPVDYLTREEDKRFVRTSARLLIAQAPRTLWHIKAHWLEKLAPHD